MADNKLDPTVVAFKDFMNKYPALIKDIRKSGRPWQEHYEKWILLGEEDPYWEQYQEEKDEKKEKQEGTKGTEKYTELFDHLAKISEKIDIDKMQNQVHQLNNTITTIQEVITQFQESKKSTTPVKKPINWLRD